MTPSEYRKIADKAAETEQQRRAAAIALRDAILSGEADGWSASDRADAYEVCKFERSKLTQFEYHAKAYDNWTCAIRRLLRLAEEG